MSTQDHQHPDTPTVSAPSSTETKISVSSVDVEPLHHPQEMAHVEVPHNVENVPQGASLMAGKTLLAKKMAASGASFYSPSDALVSPCTQKLSYQKGKRWASAKIKPTVFGKSNLNNSAVSTALNSRLEGAVQKEDLPPNCIATDTTEPENLAAAKPASTADQSRDAVSASV